MKRAPCQEIVLTGDDVDLDLLPALHTWPQDGGSFFNLGLTHTKHPETGQRNLGLYRLQRHDSRTIGMHWQIHKDSTNHYAVAQRLGERLPVAIAFGCPPVVTYAATAPLPADIDEYLFAGFVQRERVELVDCKTVPLQVPAHCRGRARGLAGTRRDAAGGPVRRPHRLLHAGRAVPGADRDRRDDAQGRRCSSRSWSAGRRPRTVRWAGPPSASSCRCSRSSSRTWWTTTLPEAGGFHNCAIVSIDKRYPKHAQKVMHAIWGAHLMSLTKLIMVVDSDCDVHDYAEVAWRAFGNVDYSRDLTVAEGVVDHLDHASYQQFCGGKAGIDATRKLPEEGYIATAAGRR